jgi:hypothetical protein
MLNTISGLLGDGVPVSLTSYESISTVTVGSGGQASVSFTSIPSTYTHLQIRAIATSNRGGGNEQDYFRVRFNSDTGTNYASHVLEGYGTGIGSFANSSSASPTTFVGGGGSAGANVFGGAVVDILDYANTNKYKTTRALSGIETNSSAGRMWFSSSLWQNTAAISTITIDSFYGASAINQYSSFALYGIK